MDVQIDVSENVRFIEKPSFLAVASKDGSYHKHICLLPRFKKRINNYAGRVPQIHAILVYCLIKDELKLYSSIQICNDVSRNKLMNCLRKLFKGNDSWTVLKIKIAPVKKSFVDSYVKRVRKSKEFGTIIKLDTILKHLNFLERKNKDRH